MYIIKSLFQIPLNKLENLRNVKLNTIKKAYQKTTAKLTHSVQILPGVLHQEEKLRD